MTASATEQRLIAKIVKRGAPLHAAQAIVGNMIDESALNPGVNEANPTVAGSRGGFGFMQWTGPRRRALEAYAADKGVNAGDEDLQLDFMFHEGATTEKAAWGNIVGAANADEAAKAVEQQFLRPGISHLESSRKHAARLADVPFDPNAPIGDTPTGTGGSSSGPTPDDRMSITQNYTGADLTDAAMTPATSYITQREQDAAQAAQEASAPGLWEGFNRAFDEQSATNALVRMYNRPEFEPDNNFQYTEDLWKEVTTGLPEEYQEVFGEATSAAHARSISAETTRSYTQDQKLAQLGWTGIGLQFGAAAFFHNGPALSFFLALGHGQRQTQRRRHHPEQRRQLVR